MATDNARASSYDDPMSERLLGIAADVLRSFGSGFGGHHLAIVGGAVPGLLVEVPPTGIEPHVGTADLDLHLSLHLLDGETADYYDSIIDGLRSLGLEADIEGDRHIKWRWVGRHRNARVQVELLCPVRTRGGRPEGPASDTPAIANMGPSGEIAALAVGFGHLVPEDTIAVERHVETVRQPDLPVSARRSCVLAVSKIRRHHASRQGERCLRRRVDARCPRPGSSERPSRVKPLGCGRLRRGT